VWNIIIIIIMHEHDKQYNTNRNENITPMQYAISHGFTKGTGAFSNLMLGRRAFPMFAVKSS